MGHPTTRPRDGLRLSRACLVIVAIPAALPTVGPAAAPTGPAQVDRVIDGDTIRVRMNGARDTVRLIGGDTPETRHPTLGVQPVGLEASADTTARLTAAIVRLDLDPAGDASDTDGRLVRDVRLPGGEHVNATLIREGYATAIRTFPDARRREYLQLEAQARRARRGRWAN